MSVTQVQNDSSNETVAVTLALDAKVYEFFRQKAQTAGVEIEPYLCSTLSIVLGCKAFANTYACSPQSFVASSCGEKQDSK
jgi:hypothetical protein